MFDTEMRFLCQQHMVQWHCSLGLTLPLSQRSVLSHSVHFLLILLVNWTKSYLLFFFYALQKKDKAVFIKAFNNVCSIYLLLLFVKLHIGKEIDLQPHFFFKKGANTRQKTHTFKNKKHFVSTNFHQGSLLSGQFLLLSELYCIFYIFILFLFIFEDI